MEVWKRELIGIMLAQVMLDSSTGESYLIIRSLCDELLELLKCCQFKLFSHSLIVLLFIMKASLSHDIMCDMCT